MPKHEYVQGDSWDVDEFPKVMTKESIFVYI